VEGGEGGAPTCMAATGGRRPDVSPKITFQPYCRRSSSREGSNTCHGAACRRIVAATAFPVGPRLQRDVFGPPPLSLGCAKLCAHARTPRRFGGGARRERRRPAGQRRRSVPCTPLPRIVGSCDDAGLCQGGTSFRVAPPLAATAEPWQRRQRRAAARVRRVAPMHAPPPSRPRRPRFPERSGARHTRAARRTAAVGCGLDARRACKSRRQARDSRRNGSGEAA